MPAALQFDGTTVGGGSFDGASLTGRPVLLWFWAPWCPTCRAQLPEVEEIGETYGDVQVVGVGSLDSASAIEQFAGRTSGFTVHLVDEKGSIWKHFGVTEQSSFVLIDAAGSESFRAGYGGSDELAERVRAVASR
ncbi:MAG TPA: redoxin family protein [Microlunatus sp.]